MLAVVVDNDTFLKQLTELLPKTKSSIWLTHKRLLHDGEDVAMEHQDEADDMREYPCLIRVTDGKQVKFSTKVAPGDLDKFYATYGSLLKSSMSATLRKRDKKREKSRAEQAARRKKRMTEPIVMKGSKRGKGRRIRQRLVKAALKQQESQRKFKEREEKRQTGGLVPAALS